MSCLPHALTPLPSALSKPKGLLSRAQIFQQPFPPKPSSALVLQTRTETVSALPSPIFPCGLRALEKGRERLK
eukprot:1389966-Pleurochrysis_carterae.AAC.2